MSSVGIYSDWDHLPWFKILTQKLDATGRFNLILGAYYCNHCDYKDLMNTNKF